MPPQLVFRDGVPTPITSEFINERIRVTQSLGEKYHSEQSLDGPTDSLLLIMCISIYAITVEIRVTNVVFSLRTLAWLSYYF